VTAQRRAGVQRPRAKGTYVSKPKAVQNRTALQGFGEAMAAQG